MAIERATNRLLRVYALGLMNDRSTSEEVKREAKQLLRESSREPEKPDRAR